MAGVQAGRLEIEIVAEIARLQQDLDKAKRAVNAASGDIARSAKAANDNLSNIGRGAGAGVAEFSREVSRLKSSIDPAWGALQKYKQEVALLQQALREGAITHAQYVAQMRTAVATYKGAGDAVTGATNAQRAGMQQLGYQLGDMSTMYAMGAKPAQIFASQIGQVTQAVQMMSGGTSKFAAFLGGPWGIAISVAVMALGPLIAKLFEAEEKTKDLSRANETLADRLDASAHSYEDVIAASRDYNKEQASARQTTLQAAAATALQTAKNIENALSIRKQLAAKLEDAKLSADIAAQTGEGEALAFALRRAASLEGSLKANADELKDLTVSARNAVNGVAEAMAKLATDPKYAIEERFRKLKNEAAASGKDVRSLTSVYADLNRQEDAALAALEHKAKASVDKVAVSAKEMGAIIAAALGATVTSQFRSPQHNKDIGGAAGSYHLTGQAIDIPLTVAGKPLTKAGISAALEPLRVDIKELLGPGDKGHSDHFHIAFGLKRLTPDQISRVQEDAAKAARKAKEAWDKEVEALTKGANDNFLQAMVDNAKAVNAEIERIAESDWDKMMADVAQAGDKVVENANAEAEARIRNNEELLKTVDYLDRLMGLDGGMGEIFRALKNGFGDVFDKVGGGFAKVRDALETVLSNLGTSFKEIGAGAAIGGVAGGAVGSGAGGSIGGAFGTVLGEKALTKGLESVMKGLGDFAGPLGAIAGGLLGGIIGGMMKSTPRASATVSIIAGEAMDTAVKGSSAKLKAIAGGMADSLISGLAGIAEQLGGQLVGDAKVSVGTRNGKYRVDTSGSGITKTSKGAVDFGEDKAAAIAFALQDAIKDGVLGGLSASLNKLITADGDIQTNLSKALSFKGVFDELWERTDPLGFALDKLSREQAALTKIFEEAGATTEEYAKLEELFGLKRAEATKQAESANDAAEKAADLARTRREMEIELMQAQGKTADALAASRALELEQMDTSLRPLKEQIYAALDAADATARLAAEQQAAADAAKALADEAARVAAAIASERAGLEGRLMQLLGDTAGLRQRELDALDPSNRALLDRIFALTDEQAATEAATKAAEEAASAQRAIATERAGLEKQILELLGDTSALRDLERAALDPSNRALYDRVNALRDEQVAADAAATAASAAAKAMQDAADAAAKIASQRRGLEIELQAALGNDGIAEAMRRTDTIAGLDPSLRPLQQQIYDALDAAEAAKLAEEALAGSRNAAEDAANAAAEAERARMAAIDEARNALAAAYDRESGALKDVIERFDGFAASIRAFRNGLIISNNPAYSYGQARGTFERTSRMAGLGDAGALQSFVGDAQAFLDASKEQSRSYVDYMRDYAKVIGGAGSAESGATGVAGAARSQLQAMNDAVAGILALGDKTDAMSEGFTAALDRYNAAMATEAIPAMTTTVATSLESVAQAVTTTGQTAQQSQAQAISATEQMAVRLDRIERLLARWDAGDSMRVSNDVDTPITTVPA